jgi:hypothetical protein
MELEKKKYNCLCGSEILESNRKAHEKSKKHLNFVGDSAEALAASRNPTKPTRTKSVRYDDEEDEEEDEEDYDEAREQGDEDEEDELVVAVDELINTVESLQHKLQLPPPWAVSLTEQIKCVEDRLSKQIADFVFSYNEHRAQDKGGDKAVWINDKSTPKV